MRIFSINPFSCLASRIVGAISSIGLNLFSWVSRLVNALSAREFLAFAVIVFIGFLIGNFIVGLVPSINTNTPVGALIAFVVPVLIVYIIWAKWGRKVAD